MSQPDPEPRETRAAPAVTGAPPSSGGPARRIRHVLRGVVLLVVLAAAGFAGWRLFFARSELPPGIVAASGRIEGDDAAVAAKTGGRIQQITVREGDAVQAGQLLAVLDDDQVRAREQQAEAVVRQAEARTRVAGQQIAVLGEQLKQNELEVEQARVDAQGRVSEAEGRLAAAEAQLAQSEAAHAQAEWDRDAFARLFERGLIAEQQAKQAENSERSQAALVRAARRQVEAARGSLTAARANLANPAIRSSRAAAVQAQILQAQADMAQLDEARANRQDLRVVAPFAGTVATRTAEPGEVVMAGTPIVTLVNLSEVYLRAFVPEGVIGRVRVGQPARIYLDSAPATPIAAVVQRIDPQATFTPENTYFREDRVKQVVGVKLLLRGAEGFAKPGMPADGEILVDGSEWPARSPR
jgi:HlyD family secretion protein